MKKLMVLWGMSCFLLTACAKSNDVPQIKKTQIKNYVLEIRNCAEFISENMGVTESFYRACEDAGMKIYTTMTESIDENIYVTYVCDTYGYAAIWINKNTDTCSIEFCINENCPYDYEAFLNTFLTEFYMRLDSNKRHQDFIDLLG